MKVDNAKVTILINQDYTTIKIVDGDASTVITEVTLSPQQLSSVLSRLSSVECMECTTGDLSRIGKQMEHRKFIFEQPWAFRRSQTDLECACNEALFKEGLHEWVSDHWYQSQDTFFTKDDVNYVRVTIRRWVEKKDDEKLAG